MDFRGVHLRSQNLSAILGKKEILPNQTQIYFLLRTPTPILPNKAPTYTPLNLYSPEIPFRKKQFSKPTTQSAEIYRGSYL